MKIELNGKPVALESGITVSALLEERGLDPQRVAVERNREIVPRDQFSRVNLEEDDCLEILQFVGGGEGGALPCLNRSKMNR